MLQHSIVGCNTSEASAAPRCILCMYFLSVGLLKKKKDTHLVFQRVPAHEDHMWVLTG